MTDLQKYIINCIEATRRHFTDLINGLTLDQVNQIPEGFNNNIAWNFGHISVSTLALAFKTSAVKPQLEIPFFKKYIKGTQPEAAIDSQELEVLKEYAISSVSIIKESIGNNEFTQVAPYTTATYGVPMTHIDEIIATIAMHDSLHLGIAKAISKAVQKN